MSANEIFILKQKNKSISICKVCKLCGNTNLLKLMKPSEFSCVQIKLCMLDGLLKPKTHFFLCEDCRILVLPCTASLKIVAISRAVSEFESTKGCFLCGSRKYLRPFIVTDQVINDAILERFTQEYTYMTPTKEKICKSCQELYTDLHELYKFLFTIIKPKETPEPTKNPSSTSCTDSDKTNAQVVSKPSMNNNKSNNQQKEVINQHTDVTNSKVVNDELHTECNEKIFSKDNTSMKITQKKITNNFSECNTGEQQQFSKDIVKKPRVNVMLSFSKTVVLSNQDFNVSKSALKCDSPPPSTKSLHTVDKYHCAKTKYPRKLPPIKKQVRFALEVQEFTPNDYLYTKREDTSYKPASIKPLRSCLKTTNSQYKKSLKNQTNAMNNLVETSLVNKHPKEAWLYNEPDEFSEENSSTSSSSSIKECDKKLKNAKNTLKPHLKSMPTKRTDTITQKINFNDSPQITNNKNSRKIDKNENSDTESENPNDYKDQYHATYQNHDSEECTSAEENSNSYEENSSNASNSSNCGQETKSTDSILEDKDYFLNNVVDEKTLRKQAIFQKSLNTTSIHGLSKLLKSVLDCDSRTPSRCFDLKTYFADKDKRALSETVSVFGDKSKTKNAIRNNADMLVHRRRRLPYSYDMNTENDDSDIPYQRDSLINYNLISTFKVDSNEPMYIILSFKDRNTDNDADTMLKVKRLQKYKPKPRAYQFRPTNNPKVQSKKKNALEKSTLLTSKSLWLDSNESFVELLEFKERETDLIKRSAGISCHDPNKNISKVETANTRNKISKDQDTINTYQPTAKEIMPVTPSTYTIDPLGISIELLNFDLPNQNKSQNVTLKPENNEPKKLFIKKNTKVTPPSNKTVLPVNKDVIPCEDIDELKEIDNIIQSTKKKICKHAQNLAKNYSIKPSTRLKNRIKNDERNRSTKKIIVGDKEVYINTDALKSNALKQDITVIYKPDAFESSDDEIPIVPNNYHHVQNLEHTNHIRPKNAFHYKLNSTEYDTKYISKTKRNSKSDGSINYFPRQDMSMEEMFENSTKNSVQASRSRSCFNHSYSDDSDSF